MAVHGQALCSSPDEVARQSRPAFDEDRLAAARSTHFVEDGFAGIALALRWIARSSTESGARCLRKELGRQRQHLATRRFGIASRADARVAGTAPGALFQVQCLSESAPGFGSV